ncbi:MAG: SprT family zinc-dependent metalloprotease [Balneolaceae bacterium]
MPQQRTYTIKVDNIPIEVTRKNVKHLRMVAYPSRKSVRISSPLHIKHKEIVEFAESKAGWIRKHFTNPNVENRRLSETYSDGSTHYLWGEPFTLRVVDDADHYRVVRVNHQTVELQVKPESNQDIRERVMREWYRRELKRPIPALIKKWEPVMDVTVKEWNVKKMRTRWGTCNTKAGRIWISLNLVKKEPEFLEYIVVHEMTHLLERGHTPRFYRLMDSFLEGWRKTDKRLGGNHWKKCAL